MTLEASPPIDGAVAAAPRVKVIFISTGNSARSQMAEAILRNEAGDRFEVVSGGVDPRPINPLTLAALARVGIDSSQAESKPVGKFVGSRFDYVITLCDRARLVCPVFPGGRETLHWGLDDPTATDGTIEDQRAAFDRVLTEVSGRLRRFIPVAHAQVVR